jgi:hypothetical protein
MSRRSKPRIIDTPSTETAQGSQPTASLVSSPPGARDRSIGRDRRAVGLDRRVVSLRHDGTRCRSPGGPGSRPTVNLMPSPPGAQDPTLGRDRRAPGSDLRQHVGSSARVRLPGICDIQPRPDHRKLRDSEADQQRRIGVRTTIGVHVLAGERAETNLRTGGASKSSRVDGMIP